MIIDTAILEICFLLDLGKYTIFYKKKKNYIRYFFKCYNINIH